LTPHPKELERLIGKWDSEEEKFEKTIAFSHYDVIVVMKGAPRISSMPKSVQEYWEMRLGHSRKRRCFNWNNYEFTGTVL
jgi:NAD(P)H-hydrate repair Nnr-like enzyme with NAD(P)H-hydrate dehydratase domain